MIMVWLDLNGSIRLADAKIDGEDGDNIGPGQPTRAVFLALSGLESSFADSVRDSPSFGQSTPPREWASGDRLPTWGVRTARVLFDFWTRQRYGDSRDGVANIAYVRMYG